MENQWLSLLEGPEYQWEYRHQGASDRELEMLEAALGRPLSAEYRAFLKLSNGAGLSRRDLWRLRLWDALNLPGWSRGFGFVPEQIAGAVAFGDDFGEEALVFDMRKPHPDGQYPIVRVNYYELEWEAALPLADTFQSLLLRNEPLY